MTHPEHDQPDLPPAAIQTGNRAVQNQLVKNTEHEVAQSVVTQLGRRTLGVIMKSSYSTNENKLLGYTTLTSEAMTLASQDDISYSLSFDIMLNNRFHLLDDNVTVKKAPRNLLKGLTSGRRHQNQIKNSLPRQIIARISVDSPDTSVVSTSQLSYPSENDHIYNKVELSARSDVGDFNPDNQPKTVDMTIDERLEHSGYAFEALKRSRNFGDVSQHVRECIRWAENKYGIAHPSDESTLPEPELTVVLGLWKDGYRKTT
jgi:hypothetical protein